MNDDYLWDKSGEPDPQIQELEEILGTLRYQPRPLKLDSAGAVRTFKGARRFASLLAIAASVLVAVVAGGLWLESRKVEASIPPVAVVTQAAPIPPSLASLPTSASHEPRKPVIVRGVKPVIIRRENQEAIAAKQQLMFALRLASEKLNVAYRRTQTPSQIRNQHRAG